MRHILIFLAVFLLYSPLFGQSEETCYVDADTTKSEFDPTLLSNISVSLISEFLKEVEHLPPAGIPMDACVYQIGAVKVKETTFVTFKGKNLNSFGNSKLPGPDGFQEAVLKALYRALEDKRKLICDAYGEFIEKCGGAVKKIPADKIGKIREMKNEYDQLGEKIVVLDTRIEKLNSAVVAENPHSIELLMEKSQQMTDKKSVMKEKSQQGILYKDSKSFPPNFDVDPSTGKIFLNEWVKSGDEKKHEVYEGNILNGAPNGQGISSFTDGARYEGQWKNGKKHGQGTMAWPDDGDKYIGKWKDDKRHGQGTYIWGKGKWEGNKYVGEWKDGVKHGQGTYTKANGLKFVGEFKDGERWNGTVTDKEGNVIEKIEDGDCDSFFFCEF